MMCREKEKLKTENEKCLRRAMTPFLCERIEPSAKKQAKGRNMTIVRVDERSSVQIKSTRPAIHAIRSMSAQGVVDVPSLLL
jgi:hypothetical protein